MRWKRVSLMRDDPRLILAPDGVFDEIRTENRFTGEVLRYDGVEIYPLSRANHFRGVPFAYLDDDYDRLLAWQRQSAKTIWLNPENELSPLAEPIHDADLMGFAGLGDDLDRQLHHPTVAQCEAWWEAWELPENIRHHVRQVAWAAYVLAVMLRRAGIRVDPILAHRGGLVHDLDKIKTLSKGYQHGRVGGDFFEKEGYPDLADIVRGHNLDTILQPGAEDRSWEINLVFFCDKLVEGDRIVSLDERFSALDQRYPEFMQRMAPTQERVMAMSDRICERLSLSGHEQLIQMLVDLQD